MKRTFTPSPSVPAATTPSREDPFDRVGRLLSQHHQWYVEPEYEDAPANPSGDPDGATTPTP